MPKLEGLGDMPGEMSGPGREQEEIRWGAMERWYLEPSLRGKMRMSRESSVENLSQENQE